jgi:hypothetical protein
MDFIHRTEFQVTRKHNVSEIGYVSIFRNWERSTYPVESFRLILAFSKGFDTVGVFIPSPEEGKGSNF